MVLSLFIFPTSVLCVSVIPLLYWLSMKAHIAPLNAIVFLSVWLSWSWLLTLPLHLFFSIDMRTTFILFYFPIFLALYRKDYETHTFFSSIAVRYSIDPPLMFVSWLIHCFGGRLLEPFISEIDDNILISSLPYFSDIPLLIEKYHVGAVVNMCAEYSGPNYPESIVQLRLPTVDHSSPSIEHLVTGVNFIEDCVKKGKRVLIHCKGGRSRSVIMAICYFLKIKSFPDLESLILHIKSKRNVVSTSTIQYSVVKQFQNLCLS